MLKTSLLVLAILLSVFAHDPFNMYSCKTDGKCNAGYKCEKGVCKWRKDCPLQLYAPPKLKKASCRMVVEVDEKGCPQTKTICDRD
ncbi:hypothetical protein OESDEN_09610 [Oesophagostomum dentatum]|uniref:Uncharacterized protein n=1 Tax=Oesophagostomum dentatum TaxID=61180 RepID=A0A0B1T319_OESDE|nr:hypothetical protein OESDEN_09610 [Oesophagostomum dentatum]